MTSDWISNPIIKRSGSSNNLIDVEMASMSEDAYVWQSRSKSNTNTDHSCFITASPAELKFEFEKETHKWSKKYAEDHIFKSRIDSFTALRNNIIRSIESEPQYWEKEEARNNMKHQIAELGALLSLAYEIIDDSCGNFKYSDKTIAAYMDGGRRYSVPSVTSNWRICLPSIIKSVFTAILTTNERIGSVTTEFYFSWGAFEALTYSIIQTYICYTALAYSINDQSRAVADLTLATSTVGNFRVVSSVVTGPKGEKVKQLLAGRINEEIVTADYFMGAVGEEVDKKAVEMDQGLGLLST